MTAAIALPATTSVPRVSRGARRAIAVVAAAALFMTGVVLAPYVMLAIFVTIAFVLGMAEVGRSIDRTFETLIALGS